MTAQAPSDQTWASAPTQPLPQRIGLRHHLPDIVIGVALFTLALLVYNATLTPSLSYLSPDGNELATVPYILGLAHSTGYPLYTWLGKLFTFLPFDVAHSMNLMSATMGAGGVALMYGVLLILLEWLRTRPVAIQDEALLLQRVIAAATALFFAFSPTFWSQTGIAEVYAPNLFMVALQLLLLLHWARVEEADPARQGRPPTWRSVAWFGAFCLAFALSTGTHFSNLGFGLGYLVFVLAVNWRFAFKPRALVVGIGLFVLGMLQHLWLPYKANTLVDVPMLGNAPKTWRGFYNYTLGAFSNFKFAFTWAEVPDRIVIYLDLLRHEFSFLGILVGVVGMWVLLLRQPRRWWLLILMYFVHLVFFTQYRVFDLEVFFIPAHYVFALFIGAGLGWLLFMIAGWARSRWPGMSWLRTYGLAGGAVILVLLLPVALQLTSHWEGNDRSGDVAINDFYLNVFDSEVLPQDAVLLGQGGVFGYDMFYWQLAYEMRLDVLIPQLSRPEPGSVDLANRPVYSTMRVETRSPGPAAPGVGLNRGPGRAPAGPWGIPPEYDIPGAWAIPVLLGNSAQPGAIGPARRAHDLVLYEVSETPPELIVSPDEANPENVTDVRLGNLTLLGYNVNDTNARPGGRLHLTFYWRGGYQALAQITTALGETTLETHTLGLGNLTRYVETFKPRPDGVIVEEYWVTIPSTLEPGQWPLVVSIGGQSVEIGLVLVQTEQI